MKFSRIDELMIQYSFSLTFTLSLTTVNCRNLESTSGRVTEIEAFTLIICSSSVVLLEPYGCIFPVHIK